MANKETDGNIELKPLWCPSQKMLLFFVYKFWLGPGIVPRGIPRPRAVRCDYQRSRMWRAHSSEFILFESHIQETPIIPLLIWQIPEKASSSVHYPIVTFRNKWKTAVPKESESPSGFCPLSRRREAGIMSTVNSSAIMCIHTFLVWQLTPARERNRWITTKFT